jgi:16S rRNA G966 N2-methylase RsmD
MKSEGHQVTPVKGIGLPYMGSKRKIASKIVDEILRRHPDCEYFYDLFGGGGAISFEAMQRPNIKRVFYNDANAGVVALIEDIRDNGVRPEYYEWVTREEFHRLKGGDDWRAGLVKTCWSFGNSQRAYLFSPENERLKRPLHNIVVHKSDAAIDEFEGITGYRVPAEHLTGETVNERRLDVMRGVKKFAGRVESLERLQQLQQLDGALSRGKLHPLQWFGRLEAIGDAPALSKLVTSSGSYADVKITTPLDKTVIYLDPPYEDTRGYPSGVDFDALKKWMAECPYTVYMSEYKSEFHEVLAIDHFSTFSTAAARKDTVEKLFCNKLNEVEHV